MSSLKKTDGDKKAKKFKQIHLGELGKGSITQSFFNSSGKKMAEVPIAEGAKPVASLNFACSGCAHQGANSCTCTQDFCACAHCPKTQESFT
jgi:hypothetical protein